MLGVGGPTPDLVTTAPGLFLKVIPSTRGAIVGWRPPPLHEIGNS